MVSAFNSTCSWRSESIPNDLGALSLLVPTLGSELDSINAEIFQENEKRANYKKENERRRHNYIPFIFELLKKLAAKGHLNKMVEEAKAKAKSKRPSAT